MNVTGIQSVRKSIFRCEKVSTITYLDVKKRALQGISDVKTGYSKKSLRFPYITDCSHN